MKFITRILLLAGVLGFASCNLTELDFENPNQVTPDQANLDDLYNSVQLNFNQFYGNYWGETASMVRMIAAIGGYNYFTNFQPQLYNNGWFNAYADFLPDAEAVIANAEAQGFNIHSGTAKIMEAYILIYLVDMFGDIPFSEALQGTAVISPASDPGEEVYAAASALLDSGVEDLENAGTSPVPSNEFFYDGDAEKWITFAKTLKLRIAVTTRLVNSNAAAEINALVTDGDLIDEASEDFAFPYGTNQLNPNSRHFLYNNHYENADGDYMATYYMWLLRAAKTDAEDNTIIDPRIRFYFYRQTSNSATNEPNAYECFYSANEPNPDDRPPHYDEVDPSLPYCIASDDGYWGRDHLNAGGIPPDGNLRTRYGLYPAGGKFDDNSFRRTQNNGVDGALGQGINPIMLSSFTDFMLAEAALTVNGVTGVDPAARLESGIRKSMDKVLGFADLVDLSNVVGTDIDGNEITAEEAYLPSQEDIDNYVNFVMAEFAAADDDGKLDIVVTEYLIALWGNGIEAYNLYRRTGKPNNMMPSLQVGPGEFVRSHFYPADHVNLNSNVEQKSLTEPVFWDDGSAVLY